jgi:hypothetical protein
VTVLSHCQGLIGDGEFYLVFSAAHRLS